MTTQVQIINWGCLAVRVEQTSQDNRRVLAEEIVQPHSISKAQFYVHDAARLVITEIEPA